MQLRSLLAATLTLFLPSALFAQTGPVDRLEILGRLAIGESPSYVAHLVKIRTLTCSPNGHFLSQVRLAGGEGILVERLQSAPAPARPEPLSTTSVSADRLARCAQLVHTQLFAEADAECRKSIEENPLSPWPLLAAALLDRQLPPFLRPSERVPEKSNENDLFLRRAASLAPDLTALRYLMPPGRSSTLTAGQQRSDSPDSDDLERFEITSGSYEYRFDPLSSGVNQRNSEPPLSSDNPITVPPDLLRRISIEPDLASGHMALARCYVYVQNFDRAEMELREATRPEPDRLYLRLATGFFYLGRRQTAYAVAELQEAVRIAPDGVMPRMLLAGAYVLLDRPSDAVSELKVVIARFPADPIPSSALIQLYIETKDGRSALGELRRFLAARPSDDYAKLVATRLSDFTAVADLLLESRLPEEAAEQWSFILRYRPDNANYHERYANVLLGLGRIDDAIAEFNQAIGLGSDNWFAHQSLGLCLLKKKDFGGAISQFREVIGSGGYSTSSQIFLGSALGRNGDLAAARKLLDEALLDQPDNPRVRIQVAFALDGLRDSAAALQHLNRAFALSPDSLEIQNDLAWFYATTTDTRLRNPVIALTLARRAVRWSSEPNPAYIDTLAEALLLSGNPNEALATEQRAFDLDPENPEMQTRLAHFREAAQASAPKKP